MLQMNGAESCFVFIVSEQCPNSLLHSGLCQWTQSTMKQETVRELEDTALILLGNQLEVGNFVTKHRRYQTDI